MFEQTLKIKDESVGLMFPESMSASVDLWFAVVAAQKETDSAQTFSKLAASAIGLGLDRSVPAASGAPVYDISSRDFVAYGNMVIDWLGVNGIRWPKLMDFGAAYLKWLSSELMADEEIVQMEDFTEAVRDRLTG